MIKNVTNFIFGIQHAVAPEPSIALSSSVRVTDDVLSTSDAKQTHRDIAIDRR